MKLEVIFENEDLIAVNKPAGLLVHRSKASSRSEPALLQLVRNHCHQHVYAAHRLDRATSGIMIFAKSPAQAEIFNRQFRQGQAHKLYLAIVRGWPQSHSIDHPLLRIDGSKIQEAQTELKSLGQMTVDIANDRYMQSRYSLVQLKPLQGRRHQLRRHLKHIHHPIIGDTAYGHGLHNQIFRSHLDCRRMLLHHRQLQIQTEKGVLLTFEAPFDAEFQSILDRFDLPVCY